MRHLLKIVLVFPILVQAQDKEIDKRMNKGELQMTFPSIYFKNKSTDYAEMPYTVDSCFKFI